MVIVYLGTGDPKLIDVLKKWEWNFMWLVIKNYRRPWQN